ncbi:PREDICTED: uncharacterized protein LOC108558382 isoform X2 [Nicrophorus vespilloides]|nr:PREDICTED: uncharacterized protein LOC108558382 isoform X2 [Nicrophorus vespilloides]XP_017770772.1 PREDICTED: uncharacterized protein LOC108558382 isoform X2 [Nicrophorus vespilloides]
MAKNVARRLNFSDNEDANSSSKDTTETFLVDSITSSCNEARDRWNFDFKEEKPLDGNWEWSEVKANSNDQGSP